MAIQAVRPSGSVGVAGPADEAGDFRVPCPGRGLCRSTMITGTFSALSDVKWSGGCESGTVGTAKSGIDGVKYTVGCVDWRTVFTGSRRCSVFRFPSVACSPSGCSTCPVRSYRWLM